MIQVPPEQLANAWPHCAGWIAAAINEGLGDENQLDVLIALARGQYGLWWEPGKFAAVTQVQQFPRRKVALIVYAGGELGALTALWAEAMKIARLNGIDAVRTHGRMGWEKVLGLKRTGVILEQSV